MSSAWAQRRWQGDAAGLKHLARHAGSLAAKNVTLAADRDLHLDEVIQIPDHVGPFQLPLLARQTVFQFLAQQQRQERAKIHARESFRLTCEKSAAYPAAISSSGRHPRPSTIVCTSAPPHAEGDPCSSSVPTCRRSALPP